MWILRFIYHVDNRVNFCFIEKMSSLKYEKVWTDKAKYEDAETQYYERLAKVCVSVSFFGCKNGVIFGVL